MGERYRTGGHVARHIYDRERQELGADGKLRDAEVGLIIDPEFGPVVVAALNGVEPSPPDDNPDWLDEPQHAAFKQALREAGRSTVFVHARRHLSASEVYWVWHVIQSYVEGRGAADTPDPQQV